LQSFDSAHAGVRLCLGAVPTEVELDRALMILRDILETLESISVV